MLFTANDIDWHWAKIRTVCCSLCKIQTNRAPIPASKPILAKNMNIAELQVLLSPRNLSSAEFSFRFTLSLPSVCKKNNIYNMTTSKWTFNTYLQKYNYESFDLASKVPETVKNCLLHQHCTFLSLLFVFMTLI